MIEYTIFILVFAFTVILPGYLLGKILLSPRNLYKMIGNIPPLPRLLITKSFHLLLSPILGIAILNLSILVLNKVNLPLSSGILWLNFTAINAILLLTNIIFIRHFKISLKPLKRFNLRSKFTLLFITLVLLSIGIRTVFYLPDVLPQNTDLGHHMYWSQWIVEKEEIPPYDTADVIIGEHLVFGTVSALSSVPILSAFPLIILSFLNLFTVAVISLSAFIASRKKYIFLSALFFAGLYFSIAPPQAKYVSGGVIGNTMGSLFIAAAFLLLLLFLNYWLQKRSDYKLMPSVISIIILLTAGSFYTHHLSTLLLLFCLFFSVIFWLILIIVRKETKRLLGFFKALFSSARFLLSIGISIAIPAYIYLPYYLRSNAVGDIAQAPEKDTHLGFSFLSFPAKMGEARFILAAVGIAAIALLLINSKYLVKLKKKFSPLFSISIAKTALPFLLIIFGWFLPLFLLGFFPNLMHIDLPSRRVVNYLTFPMSLLAAFGLVAIFAALMHLFRKKRRTLHTLLFFLILAVIWNGTGDFRTYFSFKNKFEDTVQIYEAAEYLKKTPPESIILKDHTVLTGDNWLKFFLLRGYNYFLSRTYDYKYMEGETHSNRDSCPRDMLVVPESAKGDECYGQTKTNYVILRPGEDDFLFWRSQDINQVYSSDSVSVFKIKN